MTTVEDMRDILLHEWDMLEAIRLELDNKYNLSVEGIPDGLPNWVIPARIELSKALSANVSARVRLRKL